MTRDDPGMRLARAQRLTGRATELGRAEARSAVRGRGVPGGSHVRPTRTTETGSRDERPHTGATSLQTCLVFSAPRPRPSKSPGIHRKNSGLRPSDPGVRSSAGLGGGGGSLERTRLAAISGNCPQVELAVDPRAIRLDPTRLGRRAPKQLGFEGGAAADDHGIVSFASASWECTAVPRISRSVSLETVYLTGKLTAPGRRRCAVGRLIAIVVHWHTGGAV